MKKIDMMMSDNYPPGAANDPNAPYNEVPMPEVEVKVTAKLYKETVVFAETHDCVEYEIDPDTGRRVGIHYMECDDVREAYEDQEYTPDEIMRNCIKVCQELIKEQKRWFAHVNIQKLMDSCEGWEQEELEVE